MTHPVFARSTVATAQQARNGSAQGHRGSFGQTKIDLDVLTMLLNLFVAGIFAVVFAGPALSAPSHNSHADEIQAFAVVRAMAQTASDRCTDIFVNNTMIDGASAFFHMAPGDAQDYQFAVRLEMERLATAITGAPGLKAWCDAAYRAYGPDGDIVRGLLKR